MPLRKSVANISTKCRWIRRLKFLSASIMVSQTGIVASMAFLSRPKVEQTDRSNKLVHQPADVLVRLNLGAVRISRLSPFQPLLKVASVVVVCLF